MQAGVLAGYPVVDVKVTLYDGSYHEVDSSEMAFKICGSMAFKEACQKAGPTLLEPIMKVVVIGAGRVYGRRHRRYQCPPRPDRRHGLRNGAAIVTRTCPWHMFGYATDLRSKTQGRGPVHHGAQPLRRAAEDLFRRRSSTAATDLRNRHNVPYKKVSHNIILELRRIF